MVALVDLVKRAELTAPLTQAQFDSNLTLIEAVVALKADFTDSRFTDARNPKPHQHGLADLPEVQSALSLKATVYDLGVTNDALGNLVDALAALEPGPMTTSGLGAPSDTYGNDGDFYWDITPGNRVFYGPKGSLTPGQWGTGFALVSQGDGTIQFITLEDLEDAIIAGSLSSLVTYRIIGTDQLAIVLYDTTTPNLVQISSATNPTTLLIDIIDGGQLSVGKVWDYTVKANL